MASSSSLFIVLVSVQILVLALFIPSSEAAYWCVCKEGLGDAVLQKTLDYACGAGAECSPVKQTGACYSPNTVRAHCSYAVNSYFQRKGQAQGSCDFAGTAAVSSSDPSYSGCAFPSSASAAPTTPSTATPTTRTPTTSTPVTTTPSTATPSTSTPTTSTPVTATPITSTTPTTANTPFSATPTGILGTGVSPTGITTDMSLGGFRVADGRPCSGLAFALLVVTLGLM